MFAKTNLSLSPGACFVGSLTLLVVGAGACQGASVDPTSPLTEADGGDGGAIAADVGASEVAVVGDGATLGDCTVNGCGGCAVLDKKVGDTCGVCASGAYKCDGIDRVVCADPVTTPGPGSKCGVCGASAYVCSADKKSTVCAKEDDTVAVEDLAYKNPAEGAKPGVSHLFDHAITYTTKRAGNLSTLQVFAKRIVYNCGTTVATPHPDPACDDCKWNGSIYDCKVTTPKDGALTVSVYAGEPASAAVIPLATATADSLSLPTTEGWRVFTFSVPVAVTVGKRVSFILQSSSTAWAFEVYGGLPSATPKPPADLTWSARQVYPSASSLWETRASFTVAAIATIKGCF